MLLKREIHRFYLFCFVLLVCQWVCFTIGFLYDYFFFRAKMIHFIDHYNSQKSTNKNTYTYYERTYYDHIVVRVVRVIRGVDNEIERMSC